MRVPSLPWPTAPVPRSRSTAAPGEVLDVIADFERYPQWAGEVKACTVLSEDGDGWADQVEFTLDAGAIKDQYVLEYDWDVDEDGTGVVGWHLVRATPAQGDDRHLHPRRRR